MSPIRTLLVALAGSAMLSAFIAPAYADASWGDGVEVLADTEMKDLRGGVGIPGMPNLNVNFAVIITTTMNGTPVVTTQLTVNDAGAMVEQTVGAVGQSIADMTDEQLAALGLSGLAGTSGVVISDDAGVTALAHNIADGAIQNIIVNNASGRDLGQDFDVAVELPGFDAIQDSFKSELFGIHLVDEINQHID